MDLGGTGMSVMEHSHRGKAYEAVHNEAIALTKELLSVPDNYDILLLQGGASQQFAVVPMNLLPQGKSADYILTGSWSQKAYKEAKTVGTARVSSSTERMTDSASSHRWHPGRPSRSTSLAAPAAGRRNPAPRASPTSAPAPSAAASASAAVRPGMND